MKVWPATDSDVRFVLDRLRPHCRRELFAPRAENETLANVVYELEQLAPLAIVRCALSHDGIDPVAIFAAYRASAAVAVFQTFSTAQWPAIAGPFLRWCNRVVTPELCRAGIRMAEFHVIETPDFNPRWFALMGVRPWGKPLPRGRQGERYIPMVWLPPATVDVAGFGAGSPASRDQAA